MSRWMAALTISTSLPPMAALARKACSAKHCVAFPATATSSRPKSANIPTLKNTATTRSTIPADRIRTSLDESAARLGTDYFDIIHLHDFEYQDGRHVEQALGEGLRTLHDLKRAGRIGAVSCGIYPMDLWHRVFRDADIDAALVHNHYCLYDTRLLELLPIAREKQIGIINASPFAMGLLTDRGPAAMASGIGRGPRGRQSSSRVLSPTRHQPR